MSPRSNRRNRWKCRNFPVSTSFVPLMSEFEIEREAKVHEDSNYTKNILEKYEYVKKPNENKDT